MSDEEKKDAEVAPEAATEETPVSSEAIAKEETTETSEAFEAPAAHEAPEAEEAIVEEVAPLAVDEAVEKLPGTEIHIVDVKPGMTIRVHERIKDLNAKGEERERIQVFQGMVIGIRGAGVSKTMTLRREHKGYGVEKIYPLTSPTVTKVELVKTAKVRRAKLAYLQNLRNRFKRKLKETWAVAKK